MSLFYLAIAAGLLGGVFIGFNSPLASQISARLGIVEGVFIVHFTGTLAAALGLAVIRGGNMASAASLPWYLWLAGTLGPLIVACASFAIPRVGAAATVGLLISGQLLVGVLADQFGWFGVTPRAIDPMRVIGLLVLGLGVFLIVKK